jgi:hypothetical protein
VVYVVDDHVTPSSVEYSMQSGRLVPLPNVATWTLMITEEKEEQSYVEEIMKSFDAPGSTSQ